MSVVAGSQDTCSRLLAAAIEVFTEMGYREATLRTICQRAGTNNAAVNYHFRDKEHLYLAVIEHAIETTRETRERAQSESWSTPEDRLRKSILWILTHLLGEGPPTWLMKLMARELAEPTAGLDLLVEKMIAPFDADLGAVVRGLTGPSATVQQVQDCVSSIIAQCHHYHQGRAVVFRQGTYTAYDPATIEHLADHITRFSLAGIRAIANC
jgi:TetR/AcrR family transcriptional regulator, regulator of cefoperazone and chloramphenicol sensitivity